MLRSCILILGTIMCLGAVEASEELSGKASKLVKKFNYDEAKIRAKADRDVNELREDLVEDLGKELKTATKRGNLDEALAIKELIESIKEESGSNVDLFGSRKITKPQLRFDSENSMPLFKVGTKFGKFAPMESNDALSVFEGQGIYFNQQGSAKKVIYEVQLPKAVKKLHWEGSAAKNLSITVLDAKGGELGKGGPWSGGNVPLKFSVDMKPASEFKIVIKNHIGMWFYTKKISFE